MALRITEEQYQALLQQQEAAYTKGRPDETRERGYDGPVPQDPPPVIAPLITDVGEEWKKSKKWIAALVVMMIPGVMPVVIMVGLLALFTLLAPFGAVAKHIMFVIERGQEWYALMIRAGLTIGPMYCTLIAIVILLALLIWYWKATK